jgi:hypothetical protein
VTHLELYPVQSFPPKLRAKDGRELIARPAGGERWCSVCAPPKALTIVEYFDRRKRKAWPVCYRCARRLFVGEIQGPPAPFVPYTD